LQTHQHDSSENITKVLLGSVSDNKAWQTEVIDSIQKQKWDHKDKESVQEFSLLLTASTDFERKQVIKADIIRRLRFDSMDHRQERIPAAYENTFEWVFQEFPNLNTQQTFDNYVRWLRGDEPLYWITGKAGAGKSTLTKYLFADERTRSNANVWCRSIPLVCAGFFFWNSGVDLQMSKEGLLRTLLYQVVSDSPDSIPKIFKESWDNYELWGGELHDWDWQALVTFLRAMISDRRRRFMFFIDGLDEFSGDHSDLVNLILEISRFTNVKLCVASRPWLKVETLTRTDIERFVTDKLRASDRFSSLQHDEPEDARFLINEVTGKAQGVFLWVYLVVRSLIEGLRDGDNMQELCDRIASLPSDLEELFRKILSNLDTSYFRQASMLFQLMEHVVPRPLTVLCVAFADEGFESAMKAPVKELTVGQRASRAEMVRRKLNSRSKGLLEATPVKDHPGQAQIQYLHRTVKDFLARDDIRAYVLSGTDESFVPSITLCGVYLLHLKTLVCYPYRMSTFPDIWNAVRSCLDHGSRAENILAHNQVAFYDQMDETIATLNNRNNISPRTQHWADTCIMVLHQDDCIPYLNSYPCSSFFEHAFHRGLHHYVESRITHGTISMDHCLKGETLLHRAVQNQDQRMMRFLLDRNADPNKRAFNDRSSTPWLELLRQLTYSYHTDTQTWFDIVSLFLEHKADIGIPIYDPKTTTLSPYAYEVVETAFGAWDYPRMQQLLQRAVASQGLPRSLKERIQKMTRRKRPSVLILSTTELDYIQCDNYQLPDWARPRRQRPFSDFR
jgi:hypothetical protein